MDHVVHVGRWRAFTQNPIVRFLALRSRRIVATLIRWLRAALAMFSRYFGWLLPTMAFLFRHSFDVVKTVGSLIAAALIGLFIYKSLTDHVMVIEPISMPKQLAESGHAAEVAARHLRDAISEYSRGVNTRMRRVQDTQSGLSDVRVGALYEEVEKIEVPTVHLSLGAILSSVRQLLGIVSTQAVSGEFTIADKKLWLRLRLNGAEFYRNREGEDPDNPEKLYKIAAPATLTKILPYIVAVSVGEGDPDEGLRLANLIVRDLPPSDENVSWAHNLKGSLLRQRGEPELAELELREALRLNPRLSSSHVNLGNIYKDRGDEFRAEQAYRKAVSLDGKYATAHYNLGVFLRDRQDHLGAIAEYRTALLCDPSDAGSWNNLAIAMKATSQGDKSIAEAREMVTTDPKNFMAHFYLAATLRSAERLDEAIAEYRIATKLNDNFVAGHFHLAGVLRRARSTDEAMAEYKKTIDLDRRNASAHNGLGMILLEIANIDGAILEFQEALKADPRHLARNNLGKALKGTGKYEEAAVEFRTVLKTFPRNGTAQEELDDIERLLPDLKNKRP
jgi:tetratricopeptide (TPR) repeat protein